MFQQQIVPETRIERPHSVLATEPTSVEIDNDRYADLIDGQSTTFEAGVRGIFETLTDYEDTIRAHEDRFLPGVLEDE